MNGVQLERLHEQMAKLRLTKSQERIEALLQEAADKELSYADFLDQLFTEEIASKTTNNITMRTNLARFPFVKSLDAFDFTYQPSLDKKQVQNLANCHFIEHGENVVILGPPGVGKTHLSVALGLKAIEHGYRVLFTTAANMIATLTKALSEGRLEDKLKSEDGLRPASHAQPTSDREPILLASPFVRPKPLQISIENAIFILLLTMSYTISPSDPTRRFPRRPTNIMEIK
jgi:DNA replication protein DnaC